MERQLVSSETWLSTPNSLTVYALLTILVGVIVAAIVKRFRYIQKVGRVPGVHGGYTVLGNAGDMARVSSDELFTRVVAYMYFMRSAGPVLRVWAGPFPLFFVFTAEGFETILSSNKLIDKSREYTFLHPWLNTGLLTSTGVKWQTRRKLLTPAFHFKILEDFMQVFNEHCATLVHQLDRADKNGFNVYPYVTACTLDIICDTAMGCNIHAQTETDSEYVRAVYAMSRIVQTRQARPWLQPELVFHLSSYGAEQRKSLKILHGFTNQVIQERKLEHKKRNQPSAPQAASQQTDDDFISSRFQQLSVQMHDKRMAGVTVMVDTGQTVFQSDIQRSKEQTVGKQRSREKPRLAFLDLLIEAAKDGQVLSDSDIREEVDTFMFEGHDTTTAAINWSLLLIGSDDRVQQLVHEELVSVFGDQTDRPITMADLSSLKYLECCIKEALRLYPSVPIMGRRLSEDTVIHGYEIPKNADVLLSTYTLHRDPTHFPDPELYLPERFFPENSRGRHPYAYVPFSAGARNCIGQKFALMEEKVILAYILRRFLVHSLDKRDELILLGELILRPRDGIRLRLTKRT